MLNITQHFLGIVMLVFSFRYLVKNVKAYRIAKKRYLQRMEQYNRTKELKK